MKARLGLSTSGWLLLTAASLVIIPALGLVAADAPKSDSQIEYPGAKSALQTAVQRELNGVYLRPIQHADDNVRQVAGEAVDANGGAKQPSPKRFPAPRFLKRLTSKRKTAGNESNPKSDAPKRPATTSDIQLTAQQSEIQRRLQELYERDGREMPQTGTRTQSDGSQKAATSKPATRELQLQRPKTTQPLNAQPQPKPKSTNRAKDFFRKINPFARRSKPKPPVNRPAQKTISRTQPPVSPQDAAGSPPRQLDTSNKLQQRPIQTESPNVRQVDSNSQPQVNLLPDLKIPEDAAAPKSADVVVPPPSGGDPLDDAFPDFSEEQADGGPASVKQTPPPVKQTPPPVRRIPAPVERTSPPVKQIPPTQPEAVKRPPATTPTFTPKPSRTQTDDLPVITPRGDFIPAQPRRTAPRTDVPDEDSPFTRPELKDNPFEPAKTSPSLPGEDGSFKKPIVKTPADQPAEQPAEANPFAQPAIEEPTVELPAVDKTLTVDPPANPFVQPTAEPTNTTEPADSQDNPLVEKTAEPADPAETKENPFAQPESTEPAESPDAPKLDVPALDIPEENEFKPTTTTAPSATPELPPAIPVIKEDAFTDPRTDSAPEAEVAEPNATEPAATPLPELPSLDQEVATPADDSQLTEPVAESTDAATQSPTLELPPLPEENPSEETTPAEESAPVEEQAAPALKVEFAEAPQQRTREEKMALINKRAEQKGLQGFCPVVLRDDRELEDAQAQFSSTFDSKTYHFSSVEAKDKFDQKPERYAPAAAGHDVVLLTEKTEDVEGSLVHASWFRDRLYLFSDSVTKAKFVATPGNYVVE